jgi:class 3 adenylate cyclase
MAASEGIGAGNVRRLAVNITERIVRCQIHREADTGGSGGAVRAGRDSGDEQGDSRVRPIAAFRGLDEVRGRLIDVDAHRPDHLSLPRRPSTRGRQFDRAPNDPMISPDASSVGDVRSERAAPPTPRHRRRRLFTDMSVATRVSLVALIVMLVSIAATASIGLARGNQLADDLSEDRLVTIAASRTASVEAYLVSVRREIGGLSLSPGLGDAIRSLAAGYEALADGPVPAEDTERLTEYYLAEVIPDLEAVRGVSVGVSAVVPQAPAAVRLQAAYLAPAGPDEAGATIDPSLVGDAGDGSAYSATHALVHPDLREIAVRSGLDDLFLIEARRDAIVYSFRKGIDFATGLDAGPHSGTSLASLIDGIEDDPVAGIARVVDFTSYPPAVDAPRMFVASPVVAPDGTLVGYVAGSLTVEPFDRLMSGSGPWNGFGETGDAYIVGDDTLRTSTRLYHESPAVFSTVASDPASPNLTDDQRRRIALTGTPVLVQPAGRQQTIAIESDVETSRLTNYRGLDVVTAFRSLDSEGIEWVVVAEMSSDEIDGPIQDFVRNVLLAVACFVVVVTFIVVRWSDRIVAPIRAISGRLRTVRSDGLAVVGPIDAVVPDGSPEEYLELSADIDEMIERLADRRAAVAARSAERAQLISAFLPAAAAQRRQAGDDVIDHVRTGSVVVLVVDGIGGLFVGRSESEQRDLLAEVVDQLDGLAIDLGLERVKITGTSYYAVCGVSRPCLDHAPRSVRFALAAAELVDDLASERNVTLAIGAGVDSGAITVGLSGRAGLVYDAWGPAVNGAAELGRHAPRGRVAVSAAVRRQLPTVFEFVDDGGETGDSVVAALVGEATA